ncbi:MAG TPA: VWA domain-containing protein [Spirochaetales bacterium]|nr:VWA domain-containing protein [Spirochaetales bacterium]
MENKGTDLVFILDKSGSMMGLEKDTIGGFNSLLEKQKGEKGIVWVTTVLFDHRYTILHDRLPIQGTDPITAKEYVPGGMTALYDALGRTIESLLEIPCKQMHGKKSSALFVIITDGEENASHDYTLERIRELIELCKERQGWEFLYLGANIDAFSAASKIGIDRGRATRYHADSQGVRVNFETLNSAIGQVRASEGMSDNWKDSIEEDFKSRSKG